MKRQALFTLIALTLSATPTRADGTNEFTLAGTVDEVRCELVHDRVPSKQTLPAAKELTLQIADEPWIRVPENPPPEPTWMHLECEISLQVAGSEGPFEAQVGCRDPELLEACQWLQPGDPALILGTERARGKEASHVTLWVDQLLKTERQAAAAE